MSHENKYFQEILQNNGTFTEKILLPGVNGTFLKACFGEIKLIYNSQIFFVASITFWT